MSEHSSFPPVIHSERISDAYRNHADQFQVAVSFYSEGDAEIGRRLIAAAPQMREALELAYVAMLATAQSVWRIKNQNTFCAVRDAICAATGREAEDVQTQFETVAAIFREQP